jgi:hypothetical protein
MNAGVGLGWEELGEPQCLSLLSARVWLELPLSQPILARLPLPLIVPLSQNLNLNYMLGPGLGKFQVLVSRAEEFWWGRAGVGLSWEL